MKPRLRSRMARLLLGAVVLSMVTLLAGAAAGWVVFLGYARRAAEFDLSEIGRLPQRSIVYDRTGRVTAFIQGENRFFVPLSEIPQSFLQALLAQEDSRFFEHGGLDFYGIARAALANWREGTIRQGGSTITQQLARNAFGLKERSFDRKALEAALALRIEAACPKKAILEDYVNRVYFGAGAYGVERAAQVYFGKAARSLTLAQSAYLVSLIRSPNREEDAAAALAARDRVIERMLSLGLIDGAAAAQAKAEPLGVHENRYLPSPENYVMDAVRRELDAIFPKERIDLGGLRIHTTIDPALQALGEKVVARRMTELESRRGWPHPRRSEYVPGPPDQPERPTRYVQAALVAIDNRSGAIRALVGGRDYGQSRYDRASLARRQVGSTFKPFLYTAAFERGLLPGSLIDDGRIRPGEFADIPANWSPDNADAGYNAPMPAALGLIKSRNTMSVRVGEFAGLGVVLGKADHLGFGKKLPPYPAVFLGGFEATLRELTGAFMVFPNHGKRVPPFLIARVEDASGRVLFRADRTPVPVFAPEAAAVTSKLLGEVLRIGTGARAARLGLTKPAAGKTGTSNECRDAWFIGYTRSLTCGVWVGLDRPEPIMSRGYGGTLALPLWVDFIEAAPVKSYPAGELDDAAGFVSVRLCSQGNALATAGCEAAQAAYTAALPPSMIPSRHCTAHDAWMPVVRARPVEPPPVGERRFDGDASAAPREEAFTAPPGSRVIFRGRDVEVRPPPQWRGLPVRRALPVR